MKSASRAWGEAGGRPLPLWAMKTLIVRRRH
jgi:hypothetical protein